MRIWLYPAKSPSTSTRHCLLVRYYFLLFSLVGLANPAISRMALPPHLHFFAVGILDIAERIPLSLAPVLADCLNNQSSAGMIYLSLRFEAGFSLPLIFLYFLRCRTAFVNFLNCCPSENDKSKVIGPISVRELLRNRWELSPQASEFAYFDISQHVAFSVAHLEPRDPAPRLVLWSGPVSLHAGD